MEVAHIDAFHRDTKRFWSFYRPRFADLDDKLPNPAHLALAELEHRGLLEAVITQNVDRLHTKAGSDRVIEVHGSIASSSCTSCGGELPARERRRAVRRGRDRDLRLLHGQGEARRRAVRRAAAGGGDGRGPGAVRARRPAALRRLVARGLSRWPGCRS